MSRVLIVDDDFDHAESLADVLATRGHTATLATSGEEAIGLFRDGDFDFVLLDVKLPGINGVDAFLEMKQLRPAAQIMLMTGFSVEQLVAQAIESGALGVLYKPFAAAEVLEILGKLARRGRVLVVDDDPDFVDSLVPVLTAAGYDVAVAATGTDALHKVAAQPVDCLLLDLCLPVLSGAEVYARLVDAGRAVPIILMTGGLSVPEHEVRLRSEHCGMLFKPLDAAALLAAINAVVPLGRAA